MAYSYGWKRDLPDHRDHFYNLSLSEMADLPASVDLRSACPLVYDQGNLGSCTANAVAAAYEFDLMKQGLPTYTPSRLFIYYNERLLEHTVNSDSGATIRESAKVVRSPGVCPETDWPYDIAQFTVRPPKSCYLAAKQHHSLSYQRVPQVLLQLKAVLASGYPIVFGFSVYESFESAEVAATGVVPMPGLFEAMIGGHAVCLVGYDDSTQRFTVRNSWSASWGDQGYCYMPYSYLLSWQLASDFWVIKTVE